MDEKLRGAPVGDVIHVRGIDSCGEEESASECDDGEDEKARGSAFGGGVGRRSGLGFDFGGFGDHGICFKVAQLSLISKPKRNLLGGEVPFLVRESEEVNATSRSR